jgi:hypothetical protein
VIFDPLPLLDDDGLVSLLSFCRLNRGTDFHFAIAELDAAEIGTFVQWLRDNLPDDPIEVVDAAGVADNPWIGFRQRAAQFAADTITVVTGLTASHEHTTSAEPRLFRALNVQRELLVRDLRGRWIFTVPRAFAQSLRTTAPDFSDFAAVWATQGRQEDDLHPPGVAVGLWPLAHISAPPSWPDPLRRAWRAVADRDKATASDLLDAWQVGGGEAHTAAIVRARLGLLRDEAGSAELMRELASSAPPEHAAHAWVALLEHWSAVRDLRTWETDLQRSAPVVDAQGPVLVTLRDRAEAWAEVCTGPLERAHARLLEIAGQLEQADEPEELAVTWALLSLIALGQGEFSSAQAMLEGQALARMEPDFPDGLRTLARGVLAAANLALRDADGAHRILTEEALPFWTAREDGRSRAFALGQLAACRADQGNLLEAAQAVQSALALIPSNYAEYSQLWVPAFGAMGDIREVARIHSNSSAEALARGDLRQCLACTLAIAPLRWMQLIEQVWNELASKAISQAEALGENRVQGWLHLTLAGWWARHRHDRAKVRRHATSALHLLGSGDYMSRLGAAQLLAMSASRSDGTEEVDRAALSALVAEGRRRGGSVGLSQALIASAQFEAACDDGTQSCALLREALQVAERGGLTQLAGTALALLANLEPDNDTGVRLAIRALAAHRQGGDPMEVRAICVYAKRLLARGRAGDALAARRALTRALALANSQDMRDDAQEVAALLAQAKRG